MNNNQADKSFNLKVWSMLLWMVQVIAGLILITLLDGAAFNGSPYNWNSAVGPFLLVGLMLVIWYVQHWVKRARNLLADTESN